MTLARSACLVAVLLIPSAGTAEVSRVSIAAQSIVAGGQPFGAVGPYEKLAGTIEFSLDPADPHNRAIADLERAPRGADGRVHFTSDLYVLRPADPAKGNGVLLFEIANRGRKGLLTRFNGARAAADPSAPADFGDGFLMREGYTLVWVGWEFDVVPPGLRIEAPPAGGVTGTVIARAIPDERADEIAFTDALMYPPARLDDPDARLTVRDRFPNRPTPIARDRWSFVAGPGPPRLSLQGGFEPGRTYEVTYSSSRPVVAGVGLAAVRDAAAAFRYRTDLAVQGRAAYVFGSSQSGRFLREFLSEGFNADEQNRRVFDAVWPHIAGAARGSFNERFATPTSLSGFVATREPFLDEGLLGRYAPEQRPKVFHTNTPVEYWGLGRAAALIHTARDGSRDARIPDDVRIYLLAGTQHGEAPFPPGPTPNGQQLPNPVPQREVSRALLRALHQWVRDGVLPPPSRYPRLDDRTLTSAASVKFPAIAGVGDPRTITPPSPMAGSAAPLPFLVPEVDGDGNELAGIRVPDQAVPLATTTGWNFRGERIGNPREIFPLLGAYIPFAVTRAERQARRDPRPSIEERYRSKEDYLARIRAVAGALIAERYLLDEDLEAVLARAHAHWEHATRRPATASAQK